MRTCWICGHARAVTRPWHAVARHLHADNLREAPATWFVCSPECYRLAHDLIDAVLAGGWGQDGKKAA